LKTEPWDTDIVDGGQIASNSSQNVSAGIYVGDGDLEGLARLLPDDIGSAVTIVVDRVEVDGESGDVVWLEAQGEQKAGSLASQVVGVGKSLKWGPAVGGRCHVENCCVRVNFHQTCPYYFYWVVPAAVLAAAEDQQ
jgi:hypothetical protein